MKNDIEGINYTFENLKSLESEHIFSKNLNDVVREKSDMIKWTEEWMKYRKDKEKKKKPKLKKIDIQSAFNLLSNDQLKSWVQILLVDDKEPKKKSVKSSSCYSIENLENLPADYKFNEKKSKCFDKDSMEIYFWLEKWIQIREDRVDYPRFENPVHKAQTGYMPLHKALNKYSNKQLKLWIQRLKQKRDSSSMYYSIDNLKNLPPDHEFTDEINRRFYNKQERGKYPLYQKWATEWIKWRTDKDEYECSDEEMEAMGIKDAFNLLSNKQLVAWSQKLWYTFEGIKDLSPDHKFSNDINILLRGRSKSEVSKVASDWLKIRNERQDSDADVETLDYKDKLNLLSNDQLKMLIHKWESELPPKYTLDYLKYLPPGHEFTPEINAVFKRFSKDERKIQKVYWSQEWIKIRIDKPDHPKDPLGMDIRNAFNLLSNRQIELWYGQYEK